MPTANISIRPLGQCDHSLVITTSNSINVKATLRVEFALIFNSSLNGQQSNTRLIARVLGLPVNHQENEMIAFSMILRFRLALHEVMLERILLQLCRLSQLFLESDLPCPQKVIPQQILHFVRHTSRRSVTLFACRSFAHCNPDR